ARDIKQSAAKKAINVRVDPIMGGKNIEDHFSLVLCKESIWKMFAKPGPGRISKKLPMSEDSTNDSDSPGLAGHQKASLVLTPGNRKTTRDRPKQPVQQARVYAALDNDASEELGPAALHYIGDALLSSLDA